MWLEIKERGKRHIASSHHFPYKLEQEGHLCIAALHDQRGAFSIVPYSSPGHNALEPRDKALRERDQAQWLCPLQPF